MYLSCDNFLRWLYEFKWGEAEVLSDEYENIVITTDHNHVQRSIWCVDYFGPYGKRFRSDVYHDPTKNENVMVWWFDNAESALLFRIAHSDK
jgi:hypothetical protein